MRYLGSPRFFAQSQTVGAEALRALGRHHLQGRGSWSERCQNGCSSGLIGGGEGGGGGGERIQFYKDNNLKDEIKCEKIGWEIKE